MGFLPRREVFLLFRLGPKKDERENFIARDGNKPLKKKETSFSFDILLSSP